MMDRHVVSVEDLSAHQHELLMASGRSRDNLPKKIILVVYMVGDTIRTNCLVETDGMREKTPRTLRQAVERYNQI